MKLALTLLLLLLLVPLAQAAGDEVVIAESCNEADAFDYKSQTECLLHSEILKENKVMQDENEKLMEELKTATKEKLDVNNEKRRKIFNLMMVLSSGLVLLVATYTGYLYISSSAYPEKRESAKRQLKNLVFISIAMVAISPFLIFANDIGQLTTATIYLNYFTEDTFQVPSFEPEEKGSSYANDLEANSKLSSVSSSFQLAAKSYILSMQGRNMLILTLMAIAPLIAVLFFFEPARDFGKFLIYLFLIEEFVPVVFVIILVIAQMVSTNAAPLSQMQIISAALIFSVFMHFILVLLAVLKSALEIMRERRYIESSGEI